jgi:hypothetical protein
MLNMTFMENNTDQDIKIRTLEEEIGNIKEKFAKSEESKKWYKNNSFILSMIAFIFSASITVYTLFAENKSKDEAKIASIKNSIAELRKSEPDYYQQVSSNIDANAKMAIGRIYYAKVNELVEDISSKLDDETIQKIEPSILNYYTRYLFDLGRISDAIRISKIALGKCKDKYTMVTIKRSLGTLYSMSGDSQNVDSSRKYRSEALLLTKSYSGEYGTENTMSSFEIWANDEYVNLHKKEFANLLIDSALFYAYRLDEHNQRKYENIKRLKTTKNFYNDKLNINFTSGEWLIYKNGKLIGSSTLVNLGNGFNINIDLGKKDSLEKKIYGSGSLVGDDKMRFTFTANYFKEVRDQQNNKQLYYQMATGSLELQILKNKLLIAKYKEIGQKAEVWKMIFKEEKNSYLLSETGH